MTGRHPSFKERLSRLEAELDQLIHIQESRKSRPTEHVNALSMLSHEQSSQRQQCQAINVTTRSKTMISNNRPCCIHDPGASAPLTDISRFLQHINLNISKGTQAIYKLANPTSNENEGKSENNRLCNNNYSTKRENPVVSLRKTINEDEIFKELREEKDKRLRADNQVKCLKEELKKTKAELQQKAESTIRLLQEELKDKSEKLNQAQHEIQMQEKELRSAEYLLPLKYDMTNKELQNEKKKRSEAEEKIRQLQETLQKLFLDTEEHLTLQRTTNWLKNQNENLLYLTKKLRTEIETKNGEICGKNLCIEDNLRKIKQLTNLCGKLRDLVVVMRDKVITSENKLKLAMDHCQRLTERILQAQSQIENLKKCRAENNIENVRVSELLKSSEMKNHSLYIRLEEISEVMRQQNELITRQSDTIDSKDEQLKLAYENIKLQSQRLDDLQNNFSHLQKSTDAKQKSILQAELSRSLIDLENEKENVLIKEKIIDSHLRTISEKKNKLVEQESEINKLRRNITETDRNLLIEKTNNEELLSKIKLLQLRKDELKRRVEDLEEDSLQSSENATKLEQIEKQIHLKQKEWEELKAKLIQEKNEALEALRNLSQKLSDQATDYQTELQSKQRMVDTLRTQSQEKDRQIEEGKCENMRLTKQLEEADERGENMKKHFEKALQAACESWQKTIN